MNKHVNECMGMGRIAVAIFGVVVVLGKLAVVGAFDPVRVEGSVAVVPVCAPVVGPDVVGSNGVSCILHT
jgi:hypothetical protein